MANHPVPVDDHAFRIRLDPTTVFTVLVSLIALLLTISLAFTTIVYVFEPARMPPWHFWPFMFNLEEAQNIPGWFGAALMLLCGVLMLGIGCGYFQDGRRWFGLGWWWLAAGFLYLSLDVAAIRMNLHHSLTSPSASPLVWIVPVAFVIGMAPFLKALPPDTLRAFLVAAIVLGFGAVVLDRVSIVLNTGEVRPMSSRVASNVEEAMEMLGVALFIRAALVYFAHHCRDIEMPTRDMG